MLTSIRSLDASSFEMYLSSYSFETVFAPIGNPHKNPIITAVVAFLLTLKIFDIIVPKTLDIVSIISVFMTNSANSIKGNRDGKTLSINNDVLVLTLLKFSLDSMSKINNVNVKNVM